MRAYLLVQRFTSSLEFSRPKNRPDPAENTAEVARTNADVASEVATGAQKMPRLRRRRIPLRSSRRRYRATLGFRFDPPRAMTRIRSASLRARRVVAGGWQARACRRRRDF